MIEALYNSVGFFLSIVILFVGFGVFVFWIAGLAGIAELPKSKYKTTKLIIGILFLPYPFFWLIHDIYKEYKLMQQDI